jgi:hypothetical protein
VLVSALRARLAIPTTLRRHVRRLCEVGLCRPEEGGYIVPAEALSRLAFMLRNHANPIRMFAGLGHAGVLAIWEPDGRGNVAGDAASA